MSFKETSMIFICLLLLLISGCNSSLPPSSGLPMDDCWWEYYEKEYTKHWTLSGAFPSRIYHLMTEHYEDIARKISHIQYIRVTYEETPYYEMGYIMGEILERYRKMVEHLKRPVMYKSDAVFDTIKRLQLIEMLYFEIYHLVNMMHEIPRKYKLTNNMTVPTTNEDDHHVPFDGDERAYEAQDKIERERKQREKEKKKRLKEMKQWEKLLSNGHYKTTRTPRPKNKWWPIDYGWEIDYYW